jgi:anti-sigma regulatory factor (Ser/Thr protein kinase)
MVKLCYEIEGGNFDLAGTASSQVKKVLKQLNISPLLIKKIVVALYESEVNVVAHAYKGHIEVEMHPERVDMKISDEGPGVPIALKLVQPKP